MGWGVGCKWGVKGDMPWSGVWSLVWMRYI
jgi:hypothetical protein